MMLNGTFQSSGLRQKVDALMDILWSGGLNNPMDSIEQLSYLIFLRLLSERDEQLAALGQKYTRLFSGEGAKFAWGNFVTLTGDQLFDAVRAAMEKFEELPGLSETGKLLFRRANLKIYDRPTLRAVIQGINALDLEQDGLDLKGDMYEYLLSKLNMSGTNGQFRTPRHIIDMIVKLVDPQPGESICDPACGTAGFLISSFTHILRAHTSKQALERGELTGDELSPMEWKFLEEQAFTGFDNDANMVKIAILNLYLHRLEKADIQFFNPLTQSISGTYPGKQFNVILANPPFSGAIQKESILEDINLATRDTEKLFLKWFFDHLASGGRAGVIIPAGEILSGRGGINLRKILLEQCNLKAIITLPAGAFKPYATVATAILIFDKQPPTRDVWFYELIADGFSMTGTRTPIDQNDIPDILERWPDRKEGPKSFRVSLEEIIKNGYELMPSSYKARTLELNNSGDPNEIINNILLSGNEIQERLKNLLAQVKL